MKNKEKLRTQYNESHIYGLNGCRALLSSKRWMIQKIYLNQDGIYSKDADFLKLLSKYKNIIQKLDKITFSRKFRDLRTQGVVIKFSGPLLRPLPLFSDTKKNLCLLALDNINDPQNLGQILRTAECAGIDGIILPRHDTCGMTSTVLQVSQGAFVNMPVYEVNNLHNGLKNLKNNEFWVFALENSVDSKDWHKIDLKGRMVIVVGSEGRGIRSLVLKTCDFLGTIPMQGDISSLNVSAAVSVILFERLRQLTSV